MKSFLSQTIKLLYFNQKVGIFGSKTLTWEVFSDDAEDAVASLVGALEA